MKNRLGAMGITSSTDSWMLQEVGTGTIGRTTTVCNLLSLSPGYEFQLAANYTVSGSAWTRTHICLLLQGRVMPGLKYIMDLSNVDEALATFMSVATNGQVNEADVLKTLNSNELFTRSYDGAHGQSNSNSTAKSNGNVDHIDDDAIIEMTRLHVDRDSLSSLQVQQVLDLYHDDVKCLFTPAA